jgi:hypothetical protein
MSKQMTLSTCFFTLRKLCSSQPASLNFISKVEHDYKSNLFPSANVVKTNELYAGEDPGACDVHNKVEVLLKLESTLGSQASVAWFGK